MTGRRIAAIILALCMVLTLCACGSKTSTASTATDASSTNTAAYTPDANSVLNTKVLRVGMECAYAPYNWTQNDDSNGAVPIYGSNSYANGYDVMMALKICEANGWTLEVHQLAWDSIPMAVQAGDIDCGICGQSITTKRLETMDFSDPYYYASIVTLVKSNGKYANAAGLSDLAGASCTSQILVQLKTDLTMIATRKTNIQICSRFLWSLNWKLASVSSLLAVKLLARKNLTD